MLSSSSGSSPQQHHVSFAEHLQNLTQNILRQPQILKPPYEIVIGNEAGDADSLVSALALSYTYSLPCPPSSSQSSTAPQQITTPSMIPLVPFLSISRTDLPLRRDAVLLLKRAGLSLNQNDTLCIDDPHAKVLLTGDGDGDGNDDDPSSRVALTLVDHNTVASHLAPWRSCVTRVLDHHEVVGHTGTGGEGMVEWEVAYRDGKALVGSCCTLVAERLLHRLGADERIDPGVGLALLGTILLDTANMDPKAGRGMERDDFAIGALMSRTDWGRLPVSLLAPGEEDGVVLTTEGQPDRTRLFEWLRDARTDIKFWRGLTTTDCLRLDYKRFEPTSGLGLGLSTVLLPLKDLYEKDNFREDILAFRRNVNVGLLGVASAVFSEGELRRELLLVGDKKDVDSMTLFLLGDERAATLNVVKKDDVAFDLTSGDIVMRAFEAKNPKASRKQLAPIMMIHWESITKSRGLYAL